MKVLQADRRRSERKADSFRAVIMDSDGRVLGNGRTTNVSASGLFAVFSRIKAPHDQQEFIVEIEVPTLASSRGRGAKVRRIRYRVRTVRVQQMGHMFGLGLEFLEKLV